MKVIDLHEFDTIISNIDFDLLKDKGFFDGKLNQKYASVYSKYRYALELYVNNVSDIEKYDEVLFNDPLFENVKDDKKDFYQKNTFLPLKYFYLRNNLYIERLSKEDIETIYDLNFNNKEELLEIVRRTYKDIIAELKNDSSNIMVNFGKNANRNMFVNNKKIIIGVRFEEFNNSGFEEFNNSGFEEEWLNSYINKQNRLVTLTDIIENNNKGFLNIIKYNDFNI